MKPVKKHVFTQGAIAIAVSLLFQPHALLANPTGAQVVNGAVNMTKPNASTLNVTNSPGAIINWQGFSIGAGETTRFIQQSSSSAVLNRVVGAELSAINGQLLSNGRVFLINPAGILIGPTGAIDTAGFVGSTLNLQNADFLAGKLRFSGDATSGAIINQGWIRTSYGGNVLLIAPRIENSGLIQTPGGELILAAGQKLTVSSLDQEGVQFEVQAPADAVVNVGRLLADGGAVGVFAGSIKHSGDIRANALVRDVAGKVVLKATGDIQIAAGSTTSASGGTGGTVTIESGTAHSRVAGQVLATGAQGKGGGIAILGERVTATDGALIDASGATSGGQILLGGDYQGANAAVRNATTTFVGSNAVLRADATDKGDGGRIIVWGNENTRFYGTLSAQGGPQGGNGGFAEVSGAQNLIFDGTANLSAPKGALGNLLLDPLDLFVFTGGGINGATAGSTKSSTIIDEATDFPANAVTVSPATLAGIAGNVTLFASRYMRISNDITLTTAGAGLTATVGTYVAPALPDPIALEINNTKNQLDIAANITTAGGAVAMNAPLINSVAASKITTTGGAITLTASGAIQAAQLSLDAGTALVTATPGTSLQLNAVTGSSFTPTAPNAISIGGLITTTGGPVSLTSTGSSVSASGGMTTVGGAVTLSGTSVTSSGTVTTGGGAITLTALTLSANNFGTLSAGSGAVAISGNSVSAGTIDTTGTVGLTATSGNVSSTAINNSSGVTASATTTNIIGTANVNIVSTTVLNAASITATANTPGCTSSCGGASISLTSSKDINVGALTANASATTTNAATFNNSISRSVTVTSNGGSIFAASPASQITATDVTLTTQQGSGGGIGTAATALKVDTERNLNLTPNGDFNVIATGTGPTRFNAQPGVAAAGKTYTGTLTGSSGGLTLNATATDTTVTMSKLTATGFAQRLYNQNPLLTVNTPNGALIATTVSVPEGDTRPTDLVSPFYATAALPVTLSASGALTVNAYTRQSTGASLPKTTTFSSTTGSVNLGTIVASKDTVTTTASGTGSNVSVTDLTTAGTVTVTANSGDVTVGRIDTTSGTGSVTLNASTSAGAVRAQNDTGALEITSGSSITVTGKTIGAIGFVNPLDLAGTAITLNSNRVAGGAIGFAGAPVVANTQTLTLDAYDSPFLSSSTVGASFNVSTGITALKNLTLTANAPAVGKGGLATVATEGGSGIYTLVSDGTSFTFNAGKVPTANQFANGALSLRSLTGDITLGAADLGATGSLSVTARNGSILGGAALDGGGTIALTAGQVTGAATKVAVTVGNVGAVNRPTSLTITSGNGSPSRAGTVTTGTIEGGAITVSSFNGNIVLGNIGAAVRAGAVGVTANSIGTSGTVQTGNITAASVNIADEVNNITTGNLDAAASITATSQRVVTLGTINTPSLTITCTVFLCGQPQVTTNAITGVKDLSIVGSETTINGSVTGDPTGTGTLFIGGSAYGTGKGFVNITGGSVTAGDGSNIQINAQHATNLFGFATLNAGAKGTVGIVSPSGIQQTGGTGITGATVLLSALSKAAPINQNGGDGKLDLNGVTTLTVNTGGPVAIDVNNSTLSSLTIQKTQTPAAAAFDLANLGGGQVVSLTGAANLDLTVNSPTPLNFSLDYTAGTSNTSLAGVGIKTNGGNVGLNFTGGAFDATVGGITTGGATGGGTVNVAAPGLLTTGVINTTPIGTGKGGAIGVNGNGGGVLVSGDLRTGTGGGAISINNFLAAITRGGGAQIVSEDSVSITANSSTIGATGIPLLITSPNVTLRATGTITGQGNVFAALTGTNTLSLSGDTGFDVASNAAFNTLGVATRGTGAGTMALTAPGQTYSFARPTTDLFGGAMTNTFQVVGAAGASPVAAATFTAIDGDLFVGGAGTSITVPTLTLTSASFANAVKLQGTAANPLMLNNTTQSIGTSSTQDLLVRGVVSLTGTTQNLTANRSITVQVEQGSIAINGVDQNILSTGSGGGLISFKGGAAANETAAVSASNTQLIQSPNNTASAGIRFEGGDGAGSSVTVNYSGTGAQTLQSGGNLSVKGGVGANAIAEIRTATGTQLIRSASSLDVSGGAGTGAAARIVNTGAGIQQIGESRGSTFPFSPQPYQTGNITVAAGAGTDAIAEITAVGPQQIFVRSGTLAVQGGAGTNAFARIDTASVTEQLIGCASYSGGCIDAIGTLNIGSLLAATGSGAYSRITGVGAQRVTANTAINLTGSVTGAAATLTGAGQDIRFGSSGIMTLTAGAGNNANALVHSSATQNIDRSSLTLLGGGAAGATATAQITATGNQTIDQNLARPVMLTGGVGDNSLARIASGANQTLRHNGVTMSGGSGMGSLVEIIAIGTQSVTGSGAMTLTGGGLLPGAPVGSASATIQGNSQTITAGNLTLNGGNGTAPGTTSDAVLRNLTGPQNVTASGLLLLNGGSQFSTAGILNQGTDTQNVSGGNGISLTTIAGANNTTSVLIQNTQMTQQTLTSGGGGLHLNNQGAGVLAVTSAGAQQVTSNFVNVTTSVGSTGNAVLSAAGNQWLRTTNGLLTPTGSMQVAAFGTGRANIESGASQLIELDYPDQMQFVRDGRLTIGATTAAGVSRIGAVDQTVFAKSVLVQTGGPTAGTQSELKSSGKQVLSVLNGNLQVLGGSGNNSLAQIDPTDQTILVNGGADVTGGSGVNALAQIISQGTQTFWTTNGNITVTGGTGAGSNASITAGGVQSLSASGAISANATAGGGNASIGGVAVPVTSSSSPSSPTGTVLALGDTQIGVIAETEPDNQNETDPIRRAPICF